MVSPFSVSRPSQKSEHILVRGRNSIAKHLLVREHNSIAKHILVREHNSIAKHTLMTVRLKTFSQQPVYLL